MTERTTEYGTHEAEGRQVERDTGTGGLLAACSAADRTRLRAVAQERTLEPGQTLYDQGSVALASYLVTEGGADVLVAGRHVAEVGAGALVGDVDVLGRRPYRNSVVAGTPLTVWKIDAPDLDRLLAEAPTFAQAVDRGFCLPGSG
jgi:CRP-like cAMP-binding protein